MRLWYVVKTKPRQEALGLVNLERQGYECFLPLERRKLRLRGNYRYKAEPLFPGYLFLHVDFARENTLPIRSTTGINGLIRFGDRIPNLPVEFVDDLQNRAKVNGGYIDLKEPTDWVRGDRLTVVDGPLLGWQVVFQARTSVERILVLLDLLGKQNIVEMPGDIVVTA